MEWRDSLRANLALWPAVTPNLVAVANCAGALLNEDEFLKAIQHGVAPAKSGEADEEAAAEGKLPTTARSVRQTIEILVLAGFAFRDGQGRFRITDIGDQILRFLVPSGSPPLANEQNHYLAGRALLPGLMAVPEFRATLMLASQCRGVLSAEEFNRAVPLLSALSAPSAEYVQEVSAKVTLARAGGAPQMIGPRWYKDEDYGTPNESDQRKAINPWMLLAGGGGLVLQALGNGQRRINPLLADEVARLCALDAALLELPKRNVLDASETYANGFSDRCLA